MKIDGWHIDGFGLHADHQVTDLPDGLTIVCGPNESGKTTLQHFLVGMLFGFARVDRADHHAPLRGGSYGGRLFVRDGDGEPLTIHRSKAKSSIRLTRPDGTPYDGELSTLLGGASKELYQSIFSMHLEDLAELRALSEDEVRDRVFSAGILGAGRSARAALGQLAGERDALLKPRGRGERYRIKELRSRLAVARAQLEEARREAQALPGHLRQLEALDERAAALDAAAEELRSEVRLLDVVASLWPRWSEATDARHQLDRLGPVTIPSAEAAQRLHVAIDRHRSATAAATEATERLDVARGAADALGAPALDESLLDRIDRVAALGDAARDRLVRIAELQSRADHQRDDLAAELRILGRDQRWLDDHPVEASDAADLRAAAGAVAEARADRREAQRAAESLAAELDDAAAALRHAEAELDELPTLRPADATAGLDAATALATLASQRDAAVARLADVRARLDAPAPAPEPAPTRHTARLALAVGAVVGLLAGLALAGSGATVPGALVAAVGLLLGAGALVRRGRPAVAATAAHAPEATALAALAADDLARLDGELAGPLATLRLSAPPTAAEAATIRAHAERLATAARDAEHQRQRVAQDRARHTERALRLQAAADRRIAQADARLATAEERWAAWLATRDLPPTLDATGAAEFLAAVDRARVAARALAVTEHDVATLRRGAAAFDAEIAELAALVLEPDAEADPLVLLDRLASHSRDERALHAAAREAAVAFDQAQVAEHRASRSVAEASAELEAELSAIGAANVDDAIARLERADVASALRATIDDAEARLDAAVGPASLRRSRALQLLAEADPIGWQAQLEALRHRLVDTTDERDRCLHDRATVLHEIERLGRSADVPTAELAVTSLEAELVEGVRQWAALTLAHQAVEGTLARYQRERQPDVVKRAAVLFGQVTGGAYTRLEVRDNEVFAIDGAEREVPATHLSQGTTEQLYLCMRIALAESYAKTAPLPLLLDDITVNADPIRQQQLSELLATVADQHQVFAFTCHRTVVDQLLALRPDAKVIELASRHRSAPAGTAAAGRAVSGGAPIVGPRTTTDGSDRGPGPGFTVISR